MKPFILLPFLLLFTLYSHACSCDNYNRDMNKAFKEYDFIARIRVKSKTTLNPDDTLLVHKEWLNSTRKLSVEILELFKGNPLTIILEWGVGSSCDMGLAENSEWILFGNNVKQLGYVMVNYCNTWLYLKNPTGERQWLYDSGIEASKHLRSLAGLPEKSIADGKLVSYFPDGTIAAIEKYKNEKLEAERKIYFSNGQLMEEAFYAKGVLQGHRKVYARHGQVLSEFFYENGNITHSIFWYDTTLAQRRMTASFSDTKEIPAAKIQKESEGWYDTTTKNRRSYVYYRTGNLQKEHTSFNNEDIKTSCEYFETGELKYEIFIFKASDITIERGWDINQHLISDKKWIKGKYQGGSIKK